MKLPVWWLFDTRIDWHGTMLGIGIFWYNHTFIYTCVFTYIYCTDIYIYVYFIYLKHMIHAYNFLISYVYTTKTFRVFQHEVTHTNKNVVKLNSETERNESQPFQAATLVVDWPLEDILWWLFSTSLERQLLNGEIPNTSYKVCLYTSYKCGLYIPYKCPKIMGN